MTKRALIVDDSRSARVILGRMLESYGLQVDASESAEQALEYLREHRPDVVFMDHLMPGMDGFQAVQAIKNNPNTATIPVMMYTSQEGELYVSQARALGAVGVLPKTVKQNDVSRVLYQLHLLPERREMRSSQSVAAQAAGGAAAVVQVDTPPPDPGDIELAVRGAIGPALKEHTSELRRFVLASLEAFARRITTELKNAAPVAASQPEPLEPTQEAPRGRGPLIAAALVLALLPAVVLAVLYMQALDSGSVARQTDSRLAALEEQQAQLLVLLADLRAVAGGQSASAALGRGTRDDRTSTETVPYGEPPLAGARLDRLRTLLTDLRSEGFQGKVRIVTYVGDFCLTGNGIEGYSMAAEDLPLRRCDLVGNPFDDSLTPAQRQSLGFANLVSTVRQESGDSLAVEVAYVGRQPRIPYPDRERAEAVTAGEWNRIAAQNNRVEFAAEPGS